MTIHPARKDSGSALVTVAILAIFVAGLVATYLLMVSNEYSAVARSQTWNAALPVAEAGIEDALQAMNKNASMYGKLVSWTNLIVGTGATNDGWDTSAAYRTNVIWTVNGVVTTWQTTNGTVYHIQRALEASGGRYYDVYVNNSLNNTNTGPEILSVGHVQSDVRSAVRKIYLKTRRNSVNGNLSARTTITLNGNNVTADSFDSHDQYHSDWQTVLTYKGTNNYGFYPTNPGAYTDNTAPDFATEPYRRKDNAYVASNGSISAGNANVCGYIDTGPGQAQPSMGANGVAGDVAYWIGSDPLSPLHSGIQTGHWLSDMNYKFADVTLPSTNGAPWKTVSKLNGGNAVTYGSTNYGGPYTFNYVITNGAYGGKTNYTITGSVADSILIIGTNIVLWLQSDLNFNGSGNTIWVETNSDVTIYAGGNIDMTGNGNVGINNIARYAPSFSIYGLPTCTQIKLAGQPTITAYIYAPEAELNMVGGGSGYYGAVGAFFCNSVKMTGNMSFHYDEAMNTLNPPTGYVPTNWSEVQ